MVSPLLLHQRAPSARPPLDPTHMLDSQWMIQDEPRWRSILLLQFAMRDNHVDSNAVELGDGPRIEWHFSQAG